MDKELQAKFDELWREILLLKNDDHTHNGNNKSRVEFDDLAHRKLYISHTIYGADAATAANYGVFYILPMACVVTGFQEVHQTAGTNGGAVTIDLEKLTGAEALDAGAVVLGAALDLKGTADIIQTGTMTLTLADRTLAQGDRLALKDAGTLTAVANVTVLVELTVL